MTAAAVSVAVDVVAFSRSPGGELLVLARRRTRPPFAGDWALPGQLVGEREDLEEAVRRVLLGVAGLRATRHLEQLATFGRPDRDPRGRVVSVSYLALLPQPGPPTADARWWPALNRPGLAFDHDEILDSALQRLRAKLSYSNVAYGLLPDEFTLSELQGVYQAVLGRPVDKRNFRKKVLALRMLTEGAGQRRGSHRPAQLYRFARGELALLDGVISA